MGEGEGGRQAKGKNGRSDWFSHGTPPEG